MCIPWDPARKEKQIDADLDSCEILGGVFPSKVLASTVTGLLLPA